jgi:anti-sigma factor RsiW
VNHGDVKKSLADYLEGDIGIEERASVDAHLDECDECSREVVEMQQTIRLLRLMPEPETPPMIAGNVMRRIRAGETKPRGFARFLKGIKSIFEPSFVLPASAIAAGALVVVALQDPESLALPDFMGPNPGPSQVMEPGADMATAGGGFSAQQAARIAGLEAVVPRSVSYSTPPVPRSRVRDMYVANGTGNGRRSPSNAPPSATFVMDRNQQGVRAASQTSSLDTARSRSVNGLRLSLAEAARQGISSGGEDPRDAWLARGLSDPIGFSRFIAEQNLAEQELWVARLSERAEARGLLQELTETLRKAGDPTASWLATDFEAEMERE